MWTDLTCEGQLTQVKICNIALVVYRLELELVFDFTALDMC